MEQFSTWPAYPLQFFSAGANPVDSQTYFMGAIPAAPTTITGAPFRVPFPRTGRVRKVGFLAFVGGTLGSVETGTISLRINNTTDYLISSTFDWTAQLQSTGVAFDDDSAPAVEINDYFEIKIVTPAWATNPTSVIYWGEVWVEA